MVCGMKHFLPEDWSKWSAKLRRPYQAGYFAMYSSLYDGVVTDPLLMTLPLDDHMVHRGDGIFEAFKAVEGSIYNLKGHLERLANSARGLSLTVAWSFEEIERIVVETVKVGGRPDCMIRVFVSRGPGGFGVNPYECPASQLYVMVTALGTPFMQLHPEGARLKTSVVPAKTAEMANIKNCNYAPNVLMKKEAVDAKVDFTIGFDENGYLTEGSTENLGIVTRDGRLLFPHLDRILTGTTMLRAMELAKALIGKGILKSVAFADITHADMLAAAEVVVAGTTINIASAVELDGKPIADGKPGPVAAALDELLRRDMRENQGLLTKVF